MGADFEKLSLVHGSLAFQLFIVSLTLFPHHIQNFFGYGNGCNNGNNGNGNGNGNGNNGGCGNGGVDAHDQAIAAFIIIAYLLFLVAFILLMLMNFGNELAGNKIATICALIFFFVAALCTVVGVGIFGHDTWQTFTWGGYAAGNILSNNAGFVVAAFIVGAASAICTGVFLIMQVVGGGK